jgi:hypothetical protein
MNRMGVCLFTTAALALGLGVSASERAEDQKFVGTAGWVGLVKNYELEKGHFYSAGEFRNNYFSAKGEGGLLNGASGRCPAVGEVDTNAKTVKFTGYCIVSDADGDKLYYKWQDEGDLATQRGAYEYVGGSGKYQAIRGSGTYISRLSVAWPDDTVSGYNTFLP